MADTPRTKSELLGNQFANNQAPGSITAQDMRDFIASVPAWMLAGGGWEFIYDTTTTLNLTPDTNTILPIVPDAGETLRFPSNFPEIWDPDNNKVNPPNLNDAGLFRLSFQAEYTGGTVPHIDIHLDVGANPLTLSSSIYDGSQVFAKGAGTPQWFNFIIPLFAGANFVANGGTFVIHSHGAASTITNIALSSIRVFSANPGASV